LRPAATAVRSTFNSDGRKCRFDLAQIVRREFHAGRWQIVIQMLHRLCAGNWEQSKGSEQAARERNLSRRDSFSPAKPCRTQRVDMLDCGG
jgi:hypothetical protein